MKSRTIKDRIGIVTFLLLSFFVLGSSVFGQSSIGGMVADPNRRPLADVRVELLNDVNSVLQRAITDGAGRYLFKALYPGRYVVKVLPLGTNFEEEVQDVDIENMGAGGVVGNYAQANFQLKLRKSGAGSPAVKGVVFAQEIPPDAQKSYDAAVADLSTNKIDAGIAGLENAIRIFPTYFAALSKIGLLYVSQQKFDKAKDAFTRATAVNDRSFQDWYGLAYANNALNQDAPTIAAAEKALQLDKNSVEALFVLGLAQRRVKNYAAAEKALIQAKKLDNGKTPDINWNLALLYAKNLNRPKDAANELEAYLKLLPDAPNRDNIKKLIKQFRENPAPST